MKKLAIAVTTPLIALGLASPASATTPVAYTQSCSIGYGAAYHKVKAKVWVHQQISQGKLWEWGKPWGTWRYVDIPGDPGSWVYTLSSMRLNNLPWIYHKEHPYMAWPVKPGVQPANSITVRWWVKTPYSDRRGFYSSCKLKPLNS